MPPKSSSAGVKPRFSVYVMMLILSFVALVIACILLYMEQARFKTAGVTAPAASGQIAMLASIAPDGVA